MTGVVTGAAMTGFTSPTYTLTADTAADDNARQSAVTVIGGTQTGVGAHSVSLPFTVTETRPRTLRTLGRPNLNGLIQNVGRNTYKRIIRKGAYPLSGQPAQTLISRTEYEISAGVELNDQPNLKAMLCFEAGYVSANAIGRFDTFVNAIL